MKNNEEHMIQSYCVKWFRYKYPSLLILAIPNGGARDGRTGAMLKQEGVCAGAADLLILLKDGQYVFVEMKTSKGVQSDRQKLFEWKVGTLGGRYYVCRSTDDFIRTIDREVAESERRSSERG